MEKLKLEDLQNTEVNIDFKQMHDKCFVDVSLELPPPPVALSLGSYTYKGFE